MRQFDELATYNAEVARGIVHTDAWKQKMADLQAEWERLQNALHGLQNAVQGSPTGQSAGINAWNDAYGLKCLGLW